ncbi:MAG: FAD-binding protein [Solirubrobacteraceae bacterium]
MSAEQQIESLRADVRDAGQVMPHGARTKPALSAAGDDVAPLDMTELSGIVDYDPRELTVTALAGTPISMLQAELEAHGQYLPFDPPFAAKGATVGGVVACGASGPNALRHGGVKDFIIGARFIDGLGRLISGGGRVVKNAAGFNLPRLLVGSAGRLGVILEASFKVFPRPRARITAEVELESFADAIAAIDRLMRGPLEVEALELEPPGRLIIRVLGGSDAIVDQLRASGLSVLVKDRAAEPGFWRDAAEFDWRPVDARLVRIPTTVRSVVDLERWLTGSEVVRRYSLAGNVAWFAWPEHRPLRELDATLTALGLRGTVLTGAPGQPCLGIAHEDAFAQRVRSALDPNRRFVETG